MAGPDAGLGTAGTRDSGLGRAGGSGTANATGGRAGTGQAASWERRAFENLSARRGSAFPEGVAEHRAPGAGAGLAVRRPGWRGGPAWRGKRREALRQEGARWPRMAPGGPWPGGLDAGLTGGAGCWRGRNRGRAPVGCGAAPGLAVRRRRWRGGRAGPVRPRRRRTRGTGPRGHRGRALPGSGRCRRPRSLRTSPRSAAACGPAATPRC